MDRGRESDKTGKRASFSIRCSSWLPFQLPILMGRWAHPELRDELRALFLYYICLHLSSSITSGTGVPGELQFGTTLATVKQTNTRRGLCLHLSRSIILDFGREGFAKSDLATHFYTCS